MANFLVHEIKDITFPIEQCNAFRIRWRDELEEVQFFECEEKSANHKSFSESMSKEYEKERQAVLRSRQLGEDMMVEMVS